MKYLSLIKIHKVLIDMRIISYILLVLSSLLVVGCKASYSDVSGKQEFSEFVGKVYISSTLLRIEGINPDNTELEFYLVTDSPKVQHTGPEVTSRSVIQPGSKLVVSGFWECSNCMLSKHIFVGIEPPSDQFSGKPVYIPLHLFNHLVSGKKLLIEHQ